MDKQRDSEIRRLVLAKILYLHGCSHASRKDIMSRMLAIHHFDNAIEIFLKCMPARPGEQPNKKWLDFGDLLQRIDDQSIQGRLKNLHEIRNIVQHQGDIPSMESVIKYRGDTEEFLKTICKNEFNVTYEELFLSTLIENDNLRDQVLRAEQAFGGDEFGLCIELCDEALRSATFDEANIFQAAGMLTGYWGASEELRVILDQDYLKKYNEKDYFELARELRGAIVQLGQALAGMQFLDEYRMDFLKYRRIVENLEEFSEEELRDKAEFSLNFVTNLILKWQEEGLLSS